jgi:hypothetical protein
MFSPRLGGFFCYPQWGDRFEKHNQIIWPVPVPLFRKRLN